MINRPKFMTPSINVEECVIDVTDEEIPFSCIVDANEPIHYWQIRIYKLSSNSDDRLVLDTGEVKLSPPFYAIDDRNKNVVFPINIKPYMTGAFTNQPEEYTWTISFKGETGNSVTSFEEVFFANQRPVITIEKSSDGTNFTELSAGDVISSKDCIFRCGYQQEQNVSIKRYGWKLTDKNSGNVIVNTIDKNQIYGIAGNIKFSYDGLVNNGVYTIELYVETQNNQKIYTDPIEFSVSYQTASLTNDFNVEVLNKESGIICDWSNSIAIGGKSTTKLSYRQNVPVSGNKSVEIPVGSQILYDYNANTELDIPEDSWVVISSRILEGATILFEMSGTNSMGEAISRKLFYTKETNSLEYIVQSGEGAVIKSYSLESVPSPYVWYIIKLSPYMGDNTVVSVVEKKRINYLTPSKGLYPPQELPAMQWEE